MFMRVSGLHNSELIRINPTNDRDLAIMDQLATYSLFQNILIVFFFFLSLVSMHAFKVPRNILILKYYY